MAVQLDANCYASNYLYFKIMKVELIQSNPNFEQRKDFSILKEGVQEINKGDKAYIGPLASCYGLIIPRPEGGAIIAHIPPESEKMKEYFNKLLELIKQSDQSEIAQALLFYKELKPNDPENKIINLIKEVLEQQGKIEKVRKFAYTHDLTYAIIDTAKNSIVVAPLNADLSQLHGISANTIKL